MKTLGQFLLGSLLGAGMLKLSQAVRGSGIPQQDYDRMFKANK